ncbi:aspartyl/asparaginyl beta-hydroxylase domain-containing protein [Polymorphobacter megasporae]|uniref:aspartyl/asparaginyl beta-hydroxylase domain-containing protein n=1 Tax=Glacieibacterium megasporae TaxID=2835787 RepID=UPI0021043B15|nr:aspartyl/asparaginyl beta-hydroxylase domain-containing protein [Polymorphobacter megasporae]
MSESPQTLNAAGMQRLGAGDAAAAVALFARAAALDPAAAVLWLNLANAQRQCGDEPGEADSLKRVLAIDARDLTGLIRFAELNERRGDLAKAMVAWSGVLAVAPPVAETAPPLSDILRHASAFVTARSADFAATIDAALAPAVAAVAPAARRRFDEAVAVATGRRRIYLNDCAGLHFPFLPADGYFAREHFPWLAAFEAQTPAIRAEVEALLGTGGGDGIEPYVVMDAGAPPNKWTALDKSFDWSCYYLWQYGKPIDAALAKCPATAAAIAAVPRVELPSRAPTAFFSILKPHTRIPAHTGVSNTRTTVHLPLIVPPGCGFRVGNETRPWVVGQAFAFDDTIEHEAWNDSDEVRVILIIDVWNPYLTAEEKGLLQEFYRATDASGHNPEPRD